MSGFKTPTINIVFQGRYVIGNEITVDGVTIAPKTILFANTINELTVIFRFYNPETKKFTTVSMDAPTIDAAGLADIQS